MSANQAELLQQIAQYEKMLAADPASRAFAPLAEAHRRLGNFDNALQICQEGLAKHADYSGARVLMARILMDLQTWGEAEKILVAVIRQIPDNLPAHQLLAELFARTNRRAHAEAIAKRILTMQPSDALATAIMNGKTFPAQPPPPTATMARLYEEQGHLAKALEIYRALSKRDPKLMSEVVRLEKTLINQHQIAFLEEVLELIRSRKRAA